MTTVGYGDYYPKNVFGYAVAAVVMLLGLMITALPIAIIGANFSVYHEYNKKRLFCQTKSKADKASIEMFQTDSKDRDSLEFESVFQEAPGSCSEMGSTKIAQNGVS